MTNTKYRELLADSILLPGESREILFKRIDDLEDAFQPRSRMEQTLIDEMTIDLWHKIRISTLERVIFGWQMDEQARLSPESGDAAHAARACERIAMNSNCLDMLGRWHLRYHKMYRDNVRLFLELRRALPPRDSMADILDHISDPAAEQTPPDPRAYAANTPRATPSAAANPVQGKAPQQPTPHPHPEPTEPERTPPCSPTQN